MCPAVAFHKHFTLFTSWARVATIVFKCAFHLGRSLPFRLSEAPTQKETIASCGKQNRLPLPSKLSKYPLQISLPLRLLPLRRPIGFSPRARTIGIEENQAFDFS